MPTIVRQPQPPPDLSAEMAALGDADLLRLRAIARLRARGLPGVEGMDLLNDALLRLLDGSRGRPTGVPLVAVLAQTMRSLAHSHWRRTARDRSWLVRVDAGTEAQPDPSPDPERAAAANQALAAVDSLFADDAVALRIVAGLAEGLDAAEIRQRHGLDETTYDSARRRMRRALLRLDGMGGRP